MDNMPITPKGLRLLLAGVVLMICGYILMAGGVVIICAIMHKEKDSKSN